MDDVATVNGLEVRPPMEAGPSLAIDAVVVPKLSFASHQNSVPVLRDLKVLNLGGAALENVVVDICADPAVFEPAQWRIDRIPAGGESHITKRDLKLNAGLLLQLSEAVRATVTLRARVEGADAIFRSSCSRGTSGAALPPCRSCSPPSRCPTTLRSAGWSKARAKCCAAPGGRTG
jgi:hypothetical protein